MKISALALGTLSLLGCARPTPAPQAPAAPALSTPNDCRDLADCRTHCEQKQWAACERLLTLAGPEQEPRFAQQAQVACSAGHAPSCERGAWVLARTKDPQAAELATRACSLSSPTHCLALASFMKAGDLMPPDQSSAFELFKRVCATGDARACSEVAAAYATGEGVEADPQQAAEYFDKACRSGSAAACEGYAVALLGGKGIWPDQRRAVELATKACESAGVHCLTLARLNETGGLIPQNLQRARELYDRACKDDPERGCPSYHSFIFEHGTPDEAKESVAALTKSCDGGSAAACVDVGDAYRQGRGVPANAQSAKDYFERACEMGSECEGLADVLGPTSTAREAARVRGLYERACFDAGRWSACFKAGTREAIDRGMQEADQECVAGNPKTCEVLRARRLQTP